MPNSTSHWPAEAEYDKLKHLGKDMRKRWTGWPGCGDRRAINPQRSGTKQKKANPVLPACAWQIASVQDAILPGGPDRFQKIKIPFAGH